MILVSTDVAATKLAMKLLFPVGFYSSRVQFDRANAVYHSSSSCCCSSLFRHLCGPRTESLYTQYVAYTFSEVTSRSLWSRYDRHFLSITRYNALS